MAASQRNEPERTPLLAEDENTNRQYSTVAPATEHTSPDPGSGTPDDKKSTAQQLRYVFAGLALPVRTIST